ncbi:MAG: apolipoprotein N-acyltransferase [Kangiellaceae bacterium]|nr:apolipoprotein N-acyltransferase [Kangiellaceae bacterium]
MKKVLASPQGWISFVIALIVGAFYPLGFAPLEWWPISIFSVAALWWLLKDKTPKQAFWLGSFYGLGLFGVGVSWVYVSINTFGNAPPVLAVFLTLLFVFILSLFFAILGWLQAKFFSRFSLISQIILFSLSWLMLELARGSGFVSFPWLYMGYTQTSGPLLGIATWLGVHGLSLFLLMLSLLVAEFVIARQDKAKHLLKLTVFLALGVIFSAWGLLNQPSKSQTLNIALVQPNIDQHKKWDRRFFAEIVNGMAQQTENYWGADLVVWPEAAIPAFDSQVDFILQDLQQKALESHSQFITGIPIAQDQETYFAGIKMLGQQQAEYRKQQLVPFGEYVPFASALRGLIDFFDLPMSSFSAGSSQQMPLSTEKADLIPAICYEIAFSGLIQDLANKADNHKFKAILTISNDTWFGKSWGPLQHFQIAKMRAIETGLPVIRGTNNGLTAVINPFGQVLDQEPRFEKAVLAGAFPLFNRQTWFLQYGYWTLFGLSLGLLILAFFLRKSPTDH